MSNPIKSKGCIALSIRQPWAWLIVNGYKDIENRDWKTHYRGRWMACVWRAWRVTLGSSRRTVGFRCGWATSSSVRYGPSRPGRSFSGWRMNDDLR